MKTYMRIIIVCFASLICFVVGFVGGIIYSTRGAFKTISLLQESDFAIHLSMAEEAYTEAPSTAIWALKNALKTLNNIYENKIISEREYNGQRYLIFSRILYFEKADDRETAKTMKEIGEIRRNLGATDEKTEGEILEALYKRDPRLRPL